MGDQCDKSFERGQRLGYEGQNLEEYIEKSVYANSNSLAKRGSGASRAQSETKSVVQSVARLRRYLTRWMELSDVEHSSDAVSDFMLREQFVSMCPQEMALFLKERVQRTIEETSKIAEQYVEAHGGSLVANRSTRATPTAVNRQSQSTNTLPQPSSQRSEPRSDRSKKCYICHKDGHFASDCLKNRKNRTAAAAQEQEEQPARHRSNRRRPVQRSRIPLDLRKRDHDKREENPKTATGASCQSKPSPNCQIEGCVKDGRLQLANGQSLSYAGALCNDRIGTTYHCVRVWSAIILCYATQVATTLR